MDDHHVNTWQNVPKKRKDNKSYRSMNINKNQMNARHGRKPPDCLDDVMTHPIIIDCMLLYTRH